MFFLSEIEYKLLINRILPLARENPVDPSLRGWNWYTPPLKPDYDVKIPMFLVCSKYCPTGRDAYLYMVERRRGTINEKIALGAAIHATVRKAITSFLRGEEIDFDEWYEETLIAKSVRHRFTGVKERSRIVWEFVLTRCRSRFMDAMSRQPYASMESIMATALPFLIEHRISGELLGLSGLLTIDCYDYLRNIIFDIKVSEEEHEWYRLFPTGYALVLESVYEVPVDVGCIVYVKFKGERLTIKRDLFYINDDLRSWWAEERDQKTRLIAMKMDPGIPKNCFKDCMYKEICRGKE